MALVMLSILALACSCSHAAQPMDVRLDGHSSAEARVEPGELAVETELVIAAAASLKDALTELSVQYAAAKPTIRLVFNFASSGALQNQIEEGAPVDVFLSASQEHMSKLDKDGLLVRESVQDLLSNELVLIAPVDSALEMTTIEDLASFQVERLAMGDPVSVPAGTYAIQVLESLGLAEKLKSRLILGSDVRQILAWVETNEVDAGFVYVSDASISPSVKILAVAPSGSHNPIIYPAAIVASSSSQAEAQAFIDFLRGESSRKCFAQFGFTVK